MFGHLRFRHSGGWAASAGVSMPGLDSGSARIQRTFHANPEAACCGVEQQSSQSINERCRLGSALLAHSGRFERLGGVRARV